MTNSNKKDRVIFKEISGRAIVDGKNTDLRLIYNSETKKTELCRMKIARQIQDSFIEEIGGVIHPDIKKLDRKALSAMVLMRAKFLSEYSPEITFNMSRVEKK